MSSSTNTNSNVDTLNSGGVSTRNKSQRDKAVTLGCTKLPANIGSNMVGASEMSLLESNIIGSVREFVGNQLEDLRRSIFAHIDEKLGFVNDYLNNLNSRVAELETKLAVMEDKYKDLQRANCSNDLVITGIPFVTGEKPLELYKNIAKCLDVAVSPYANAFRVKSKGSSNPTTTSTATTGVVKQSRLSLVVKLSSQSERNAVLSAMRKRRVPLSLSDLNCGFSSCSNIGVFESLPVEDRTILKKALYLRNQSKLFSVRTWNGAVHVKLKKLDIEYVKVNSVSHLESLLVL